MRTTTSARADSRRYQAALAVALLAGAIIVVGCGGGSVTQETAFAAIKPKEALPEKQQVPRQANNFVVRVDNVADSRTSYKNYIKLFVNGHEVATPPGHDNLSATYYYSMRLREGVYEVRAEYHAVGSWRKRVFDIVAEEPVTILPNQRTLLEVRLEKNERGMLQQAPAHFRARFVQMTPPPVTTTSPATPPTDKATPPTEKPSTIDEPWW